MIAQQQQQHAQQHEYPTSSMPPDMHNGGVQPILSLQEYATLIHNVNVTTMPILQL